jgi:hypothetical protein
VNLARAAWGSSIPILATLPLHRYACWTADLDPDAAWTGSAPRSAVRGCTCQTFHQRDVTKALKGAFASRAQSVRIEISPDGKITVLADKSQSIKDASHGTNE